MLSPQSPISAELGAVRLELAQVGGPAMVVQLMRQSPNHDAVQASGCRALCEQLEFAGDGGKECTDNGGMEATVSALFKCNYNLEVMLPGLRLLSLVQIGSAFDRLGDLNVFRALILNCMHHHISNVELQLSSMRIISNFSKLGNAERNLLLAETVSDNSVDPRAPQKQSERAC